MRYDRARGSLDRHATYIVAAYIAGAARCGHRLEQLCPAAASRCRRTEPSLPTIRPTFVGNAPRSQSEREPPFGVLEAALMPCLSTAQI